MLVREVTVCLDSYRDGRGLIRIAALIVGLPDGASIHLTKENSHLRMRTGLAFLAGLFGPGCKLCNWQIAIAEDLRSCGFRCGTVALGEQDSGGQNGGAPSIRLSTAAQTTIKAGKTPVQGCGVAGSVD